MDVDGLLQSQYLILPGIIQSNTQYYWRIKANGPGGTGTWSSQWFFNTLSLPNSPSLIIPPCNATNASIYPAFDWSDVSGATYYIFQLSKSQLFDSLVVHDTIPPSLPSITLQYNTKYYWRVKAGNTCGTGNWSAICSFNTIILLGIINISSEIPTENKLYSNYPNPFNPMTKIRFDIPRWRGEGGWTTTLRIYDITGREIQTLVNEKLQPGTYEATFDGSMLTSGVYFYKLMTDGYTETKKMILIK